MIIPKQETGTVSSRHQRVLEKTALPGALLLGGHEYEADKLAPFHTSCLTRMGSVEPIFVETSTGGRSKPMSLSC